MRQGQLEEVVLSGRTSTSTVTVLFQGLSYTVVKGDRSIEILRNISGSCKSGRVLAIMGSSGAGKTTLLDMLAGVAVSKRVRVSGTVLVNGAPRRRSEFQRISSHVLQSDVLMPSSTVREALAVSALLKLPHTLSHAEKMARVDAIIQELDLEGCQHTLIGDEAQQMKGISGGQKRRVSVGMELVKEPRLLFLDEPTSGLDSEMATSLMETLVGLARKGRTVCLTIHQPNSLITSMYDDFMLLGAGRVIYFGPWDGAMDFFAANGYPCPMFQNPTDFFLHTLRDPEVLDALAVSFIASNPEHGLIELEAGKAAKELLPSSKSASSLGLEAGESQEFEGAQQQQGQLAEAPVALRTQAPYYYQVYLLMGRMMRMWWRNPNMLFAELLQYIFEAIFVGLMYLRLNHSVKTGVPDRISSVWFAMAILSFTPSYTAVTQWERERLLLRRELNSGMYTLGSWFLSKTATVTPIQIAQTVAFCCVTYFMVGYVAEAGPFFLVLAVFCMFQLTSESIGVLCAVLTKNATYAVLLLTFMLLFVLSFSGFLVSDIPVYFRWIQKCSYLTYALSAIIQSQFDATTFYDESGTPVPGSELVPSNLQTGLSVGGNTLVLFALMVGIRMVAYAAIEAGALLKLI